jgi:uncharacterized protein YcbX
MDTAPSATDVTDPHTDTDADADTSVDSDSDTDTARGPTSEGLATAEPRIDRIRVYPVKSLDPVDVDTAAVLPDGGLSADREWAIVDADGDYVNGKRERAVHRIRSRYDPETTRLWIRLPAWDEARSYVLSTPSDRDAVTAALTAYFGYDVAIRRDETGGFPDDTAAAGPTVISTATIHEVAGWFDGIDPEGMRRRLRANLEVSGVPPFWEDHLFADSGAVVAFELRGEDGRSVPFEGVNPCQRCVVPSRDPDTGAETPDFRETFMRRREATLPDWSGGDRFDHSFRLMVNTRVPRAAVGRRVAVGDAVRRLGVREA